MNRKALLVAIVCAAVGVILLVLHQRRFEEQASGGRPVQVLMAVQELALGETLTEAKLGTRFIPESYLEDRHIRRSDLRRVIGVRLATTVRANQALLWTDLATSSDARRDLSSLVRAGMRAVNINPSQSSNFSGLLRPGDRVDLLVTMQRSGTETTERLTLPVLQNVLVLATGMNTGGEAQSARTNGAATSDANSTSPQMTLMTTFDEAALIIFAQDRGALSVVLRNPDDIQVVENLPETNIGNLIQARGRPHGTVSRPTAPANPGIEVIRGNTQH